MVDNRYAAKLREQLTFMRNSCDAYDRGDVAEAIRIGTSLRVLLHQTSSSTSLLTHLSAADVLLLSTATGTDPAKVSEIHFSDKFVYMTSQGHFGPILGNGPVKRQVPASTWWNQIVLILNRHPLTRKELALLATDKDGGAHVDSDLPDNYKKLISGVWKKHTGQPVANHHALYLRQMGYELLNSPELIKLAS